MIRIYKRHKRRQRIRVDITKAHEAAEKNRERYLGAIRRGDTRDQKRFYTKLCFYRAEVMRLTGELV